MAEPWMSLSEFYADYYDQKAREEEAAEIWVDEPDDASVGDPLLEKDES